MCWIFLPFSYSVDYSISVLVIVVAKQMNEEVFKVSCMLNIAETQACSEASMPEGQVPRGNLMKSEDYHVGYFVKCPRWMMIPI